jgi:hypothetical protein
MANLSTNLGNITNQLSAGQHGQHGQKKDRFNFNDYYDRKRRIQIKIETNAQKRNAIQEKWVFENCCVLVLDKNTFKPNQIFNIVKTKLIALDISENQIESISQLASSKNWQIQFNNDQAFNKALGKTIDFENEMSLTFIDANNRVNYTRNYVQKPVTLSVFLRVHWLPCRFKEKLVEFLNTDAPFLKVIDISLGKWDEGKSSIDNGIYNVKVNYEIEDHHKFMEFLGLQKIEGHNALFHLSGAPPKCLYCKQFGHMRKSCLKLKTTCDKCNKTGHSSDDCTLANRISSNAIDLDLDDEVIQVDDENPTTDTSNSKSAGGSSTLIGATPDLEITESVPATTSVAQAVTANPDQTIKVKKENVEKVINQVATNSNFAIPPARASSVDPKVKPVKQFILKPAADIEPKDLKKPKGVNKKVWEKMTEVEKRAQIQAIAQAEFDATNLAVKQALASRSGSLKRQSSSANIDQEANKKAATNGDGQSASNSLSANTDDVLD